MNVQDIVVLARAGFTAEQITGFFQADQPQPAAPAAQPDPQPQPQPQPDPQPAAQPDPYAALMAELQGIRAQIQQNNRSSAQQPETGELTGDQVLANIIAPPKRQN